MKSYFLAIDLGASSGRHILGNINGGRLQLEEIYRFDNGMCMKNGHLCWDDEHLFREIVAGMKKCGELGKIPVSVGIDTWGVDFRLLDENGKPIGDFVGYRDHRTDFIRHKLDNTVSQEELFFRTGIQFQPYNTFNQLYALQLKTPEALKNAHTMLLTPDYFNYRLSGVKKQELTIASTSQMLTLQGNDWDYALIESIGLPTKMLLPPRSGRHCRWHFKKRDR